MILASKKNWDQVSLDDWLNLTCPWRPLEREVATIKDVVLELNKINQIKRVAILGSTPELRSIFIQNLKLPSKMKIDVIDQSKHMYKEMSLLLKPRYDEVFHESDWVKFFSSSNFNVNLVVGDLILRILSDDYIKKLFKNIASSLTSNGQMILRIHVKQSPRLILISILKLMKRHQDQLVTTKESASQLFFLLSSLFYGKNISLHLMSIIVFFRNRMKSGPNRKLLGLFLKKYKGFPFIFYERSLKEITKLLEPNFKLVDCKSTSNKWVKTAVIVCQRP